MNITALARALRITPQELRDNLPKLGFDIGRKAIKINRQVANRIIKEWPKLRRQLERMKAEEMAKNIGCEGFHIHEFENKEWYMPCEKHELKNK